MVKSLGTKELETSRLLLRKIKLEDASRAYINWLTDEKVNQFINWNLHKNIKETESLFENWIREYENNNIYRWMIVEKSSEEPIGTIEVVSLSKKNKVCELGINIGSPWWGKGYATESLKITSLFLLNEVGFYVVEAKHRSENIGCGKALQKSGMKFEGTLRSRRIDKKDGHRDDLNYYSISKDDLLIQ